MLYKSPYYFREKLCISICPTEMQQIGTDYVFYISNTITWINNISNPETFMIQPKHVKSPPLVIINKINLRKNIR